MTEHGSDVPHGPPGRPPATTVFGAVAVGAALVAAAMRRGLAITNADSLLSGLISTERLTAFYWGQDRLANVVPAIAWPVQQVRWNHLVQTAILAAAFFVLVASAVRFHATLTRTPTTWPLIVAGTFITGAFALAILTRAATYVLVLEQQYALSTTAYLGGLALLGRPSRRAWAAGAGVLTVATAIIPSSVLLTPIVLITPRERATGDVAWIRWARSAAAAIVAFVIAGVASRTLADDYPGTEAYTDFSAARLADGFGHAVANISDSVHLWLALPVAAGCVAVLVARRRMLTPAARRAYLLCPVVAVAWVSLFSANAWVEINTFHFRYFFVAYAAGIVALAGAVTEASAWAASRVDGVRLPRVPVRAAAVAAVAAVVIGAALVTSADVPSIDAGAALATDADRLGADVVVGDYWRVWPAVFASREDGGDLLAAAPRAEALRDEFRRRLREQGSLTALCLAADVAPCLEELGIGTRMQWRVVSVRSTEPLVIEVAAAA